LSLTVRPVASEDAPALAELLNAVIVRGGTTALEHAFTPERLAETYLDGPNVLACLVAVDTETGQPEGFETLIRDSGLPDDIGDIGTFARVDGAQKGIGSALFAEMVKAARAHGLTAINATIRADNVGGLAFYAKQGFVDHDVTRAVPLSDGTPVDRVHKRFALVIQDAPVEDMVNV
jgi:ribosomal protein S18 acetylase RimI-like enzyme